MDESPKSSGDEIENQANHAEVEAKVEVDVKVKVKDDTVLHFSRFYPQQIFGPDIFVDFLLILLLVLPTKP